jgi:hypothetical protein
MEADGASPFYNPVFVLTLSAPDLAGVMAHEVMHPALQLHTRRGGSQLNPLSTWRVIMPPTRCSSAGASTQQLALGTEL